MNLKFRRKLIALITFIPGTYFLLEFLLPKEIGSFKFGNYHEEILDGLVILGNMAIGLGIINILFVHGGRLLKLQKAWINSFALILGLFVMLFIQGTDMYLSLSNLNKWKPIADQELFLNKINSDSSLSFEQKIEKISLLQDFVVKKIHSLPQQNKNYTSEQIIIYQKLQNELNKEEKELLEYSTFLKTKFQEKNNDEIKKQSEILVQAIRDLTVTVKDLLQLNYENLTIKKSSKLMYQGFFVPLSTSMFSLLAFYIAYAAYRSFRVKSVEAGIMMLTAILVILGQIPQGRLISEQMPAIRGWLMENINTPGNRAIYFGAAIAGLAMAIRMWLSLERSPLQEKE